MSDRGGSPAVDLVLVGGGHSHVVALRELGMRPIPGARLTLISPDRYTPYSGMLPGYVAGHYSHDAIHIDLVRLAGFAGVRFVQSSAVGLEREARRVICRDGESVAYDMLSINVGAAPAQVSMDAADAVPVKPVHRFAQRWRALLERVLATPGRIRVAVAGAGAGGVELILAMQYRLRRELGARGRDPADAVFHLFSSSTEILPTHNAFVRRTFDRVLAERGVVVHRAARVEEVSAGRVYTSGGHTVDEVDVDTLFWATQAAGPAWLRETGLAVDGQGFIQVRDTLQSVSDPRVFAAGDAASMVRHPREKAGVVAVRQGRPLAVNLRRAVVGNALKPYRPQSRWLALISTGDRYAVASRGALGLRGHWVWRWKDGIDRRFMEQFARLPASG